MIPVAVALGSNLGHREEYVRNAIASLGRSIQNIQKIVRHHHERWDGSGYPDSLKGDLIPLASRMIAIADAYDTMITERTYKRSRTRQEAFEELRRCAASQFDPRLVEAFLDAMGAEVVAEEPQPPASRV